MALKSQGTQLYFIDPSDGTVTPVGCPTSISGVDTQPEQVEVTCLNSDAREYLAGMPTPQEASFDLYFDPSEASHQTLYALKQSGDTLHWAIGFSDGTDVPSATASAPYDWDTLATTRSFITFDGYISSLPPSFSVNEAVTATVGIQITGAIATSWKA